MAGLFQRIGASGDEIPLGEHTRASDILAGKKTHRDLRPMLSDDYAAQIESLLAEDAHVTQLAVDGTVRAVAVWRVFTSTYCGPRLDVDDLVTDGATRSEGFGRVLLTWLEEQARIRGCRTVTLNSAFHRTEAHRFYDRQGYGKMAFHFSKPLPAP